MTSRKILKSQEYKGGVVMAQNESPKPSAHTQQKESQGKERLKNVKGEKDNEIKEMITIIKVEG